MVLRTDARCEMQDMALCADPEIQDPRYPASCNLYLVSCILNLCEAQASWILHLASCTYPCVVDRMTIF